MAFGPITSSFSVELDFRLINRRPHMFVIFFFFFSSRCFSRLNSIPKDESRLSLKFQLVYVAWTVLLKINLHTRQFQSFRLISREIKKWYYMNLFFKGQRGSGRRLDTSVTLGALQPRYGICYSRTWNAFWRSVIFWDKTGTLGFVLTFSNPVWFVLSNWIFWHTLIWWSFLDSKEDCIKFKIYF